VSDKDKVEYFHQWLNKDIIIWDMELVYNIIYLGRSGDVMANQPKAAGSSLILQLTKYLTVSALR
jgi:hypothetical protein